MKDEIRRKYKVINILLDNFSNRVTEHSNYITSKNTEVSTQNEHQTKNNIQISTAGKNHPTIIASEKKEKKMIKTTRAQLNINRINSSTCDKTHVNNSSNHEEREPLDQDDKKSESEEIIEQINPNTLHKRRPCTVIVGDSTVKYLHGKSIANKTNSDNIILVKSIPRARNKKGWYYIYGSI